MTLLYCGRMDDHDEHDWPGFKAAYADPTYAFPTRVERTTYHCKGTPVSEGAAPCMDCGKPSANGGPRCIPCAQESARHESEKDIDYWE